MHDYSFRGCPDQLCGVNPAVGRDGITVESLSVESRLIPMPPKRGNYSGALAPGFSVTGGEGETRTPTPFST